MRIALDTNVIVYAEGLNGPARRAAGRRLIDRLHADHELIVAAQCLGELHRVLAGKARMTPAMASEIADSWRRLAIVPATSEAVVFSAFELVATHPHQIWDAIILCAAAEAGCGLLLSEDMQDGFVYRGVTVANPFAETLHPLLASLLEIPS